MGRNKKIGAMGWMISLILILMPSIVKADLGDVLSLFEFQGIVQETYNSNVGLSPTAGGKRDDFITNVGANVTFSTLPKSETTLGFQPPAANGTLPNSGFQLPALGEEIGSGILLNFHPSYVYYAKGVGRDYLSLAGNLDSWYTWDGKLTFRVRDYLIRSEDPLEQNYAANALPGQILLGTQRGVPIYIRNVLEPSLQYKFGGESPLNQDILAINYRYMIYRNDLFGDSTQNHINPSLTYWFDIRNGVYLGYALDLGTLNRVDMTGNFAVARYTYRFNPTASIFGEYTFQTRTFDNHVSSSTTNYDVHQPTIGFDYAFSPTLSLRAQFGYFWQIPRQGSTNAGPVYNVIITQTTPKTTYTLGFRGGYYEDLYTAQNLGFAKYHSVIGTISHQLAQRFTVTFSARYQRPQYPNGRVENIWGVTGTTSYRLLKWLTADLSLSYLEDHSNKGVNNYNDFRGTVRIIATY